MFLFENQAFFLPFKVLSENFLAKFKVILKEAFVISILQFCVQSY